MIATSVTDRDDWREFCTRAAADLTVLDLEPPDPVMADVLGGSRAWIERRYAAIADDICARFRQRRRVVELGAGYGGLGRILLDTCGVRHYATIDLPEAWALQRAYLGEADHHAADLHGARYDLAVSNYALTELRADLQLTYARELRAAATHGYVTWNGFTTGAVPLADLQHVLLAAVRPAIGPTHHQCALLVW